MTQTFQWDTGGGEGGTPPIGRSIIAGNGLTGGGDLSQDRTLDVGAGDGIGVGLDEVHVKLATTSGLSLSGGDLQLDDSVAGSGLAIGSKILSVNVGNGIEISSDAVAVKLATTSGLEFSGGDLQINDTIAGSGLSITNKILAVGAGTLMTVAADTIGLSNGTAQYQVPMTGATPFTPVYSTTSANPGAAIALLRTDANGYLTLTKLNTDTLSDRSGGNLTISPTGDVVFDPTGNDILPNTNYDINLGSLTKKYLTVHAAELWVETLVAQDVIATIGGHILVAPTTLLVSDLSATQTNYCSNPGYETAGGGGADVFANWTEYVGTGGSITRLGLGAHGGTYCARLIEGTGTGTYIEQAIDPGTPGDYVTWYFWTKGDGVDCGQYAVWDNAHGSFIVAWTDTGVTGTTWTRVAVTFQMGTGDTSYNFALRPKSSRTVYFDDNLITVDYFYTKHNNLAPNDFVYLQTAPSGTPQVEWMKILGGPYGSAGNYSYYIQRNLDDTGTNNWYSGDAVLNTGGQYEGFIDIYSVSSIRGATQYGPTIQGVWRWGTSYAATGETWAIGNLNGLYGYSTDTYGLGLGFYGWGYQHVTLDNSNGMRFSRLDGSGVYHQMARWYADGTILIGEVGASKENILISSGAINFRLNEVVNMNISTSGVITIGASSSPQVSIDSSGMNFKNSSGNTLLLVDSANSRIDFGLAPNVRLDSTGMRLKALYGSNATIKFTDGITSGSDFLTLKGAPVASGEFWGLLFMDVNAGGYNMLDVGVNAGGTGGKVTYLRLTSWATDNSALFNIGNSNVFHIKDTGTVVNEDSLDYDFRIESNGNANMFLVDGGLDAVAIGTTAVSGVELNVAGTIRLSDTLEITNNSGTPAYYSSGLNLFSKSGSLIQNSDLNRRANLTGGGSGVGFLVPLTYPGIRALWFPSGATVTDFTPNHIPLSPSNMASWYKGTPPGILYCGDYNGSSSQMTASLSTYTLLNATNWLTFGAWVFINGTGRNHGLANQGTSTQSWYLLWYNAGGYWEFGYWDTGGVQRQIQRTQTLTTGWHFIGFEHGWTASGNNHTLIRVNNTTTTLDNQAWNGMRSGGGNFCVGSANNGTYWLYGRTGPVFYGGYAPTTAGDMLLDFYHHTVGYFVFG